MAKTAFECFQHAARCQQMARKARNESARDGLLDVARCWRKLGDEAEAKDSKQQTIEPAATRRD